MSDVCQLEITQDEYDHVKQCESVVVREYERPNGSRFSNVVAWGDAEEMVDRASIVDLLIVPVGIKVVCQRAILVSELIG